MLFRQVPQTPHDILLGVHRRRVIGEADEGTTVLLVRFDHDDLEVVVLEVGEKRMQLVEKGLFPKVAHEAAGTARSL